MAFSTRVGSILRQSISQNSASFMMNSVRCMSSNLFVGGLSYGTDDGSLKDAFSKYGEVVEARVIIDRNTGRSRGFGFVKFADTEAANSAKSAMDGQELHGRIIRVNIANDRPPASRGGGFGAGGGYQSSGGYQSGGGYSGGYQRNTGFGGSQNEDF